MPRFDKVVNWGEFVNDQYEKEYDIQQKYYKCKDIIINFKDCISFIESKIAELNKTVRMCKDLVKRCHSEIKSHAPSKNIIKIKKTAEHQWTDAGAIQDLSDNCKDMKDECWKLSKQWRQVEDLDKYILDSNKKMEEYYQYLSSIDDMMSGYQTITDELQGMILGLEDKHLNETVGPFKLPEVTNMVLDECVKVDTGSVGQMAQLNRFWNDVVTSQDKYKKVIEEKKEFDKQVDELNLAMSETSSDGSDCSGRRYVVWSVDDLDDDIKKGYDSDFM